MTVSHETKTAARKRLVALYRDRTTVRRVLSEAGIDDARIDLSGSPEDMWFNAINETANLGRLEAVLAVADREFPLPAPPVVAPTPMRATPTTTWRIGAPSRGLDFRKLTGEQWKVLQHGLVEAFPSMHALREFVRHRLDENLNAIANTNGGINEAAYELISWSHSRGHTERLYRAARAERPDNTFLTELELYATPPTPGASVAPVMAGSLERVLRKVERPIQLVDLIKHLGEASARVCQIRVKGTPYGTGFLIGPSAVMTNHHVVKEAIDDASLWPTIALHFDVHPGDDGTVVRLDHEALIAASAPTDAEDPGVKPHGANDPRLDYAVLRVEGMPGVKPIGGAKSTPNAAVRGYFKLPEGDVSLTDNDALYIVQHPKGRPMEIALEIEAGAAFNAERTRLSHKVNTEGGSSGSPVFTLHGALVALHHSGESMTLSTHNQAIPIDAIYRSLKALDVLGDIAGQ
jgi:hypothetical protein